MYKTILAPLDGSKRAEAILPHLEQLAKLYNAKVIFLQAIEQSILFTRPETAFVEQKRYEEYTREAKIYLDCLKGEFREKGIEARAFIVHGPVVDAIINAARTGNIGDGGAANFRTAVYIQADKDMLTVGTDAGVLAAQEPHFDRWFLLGEDLPDVVVYDLDYDAADDLLLAGTLGRGAWTLDNPADVSIPVITVPASQLDFGTVCGPVTGTLEVCNTGMANLQIDSITSSDPQFSVTEPTRKPLITSYLRDYCLVYVFVLQLTRFLMRYSQGPQTTV